MKSSKVRREEEGSVFKLDKRQAGLPFFSLSSLLLSSLFHYQASNTRDGREMSIPAITVDLI